MYIAPEGTPLRMRVKGACVGEALVDGGPLHWKYYSLDDIPKEQRPKDGVMLKKLEKELVEKNAWKVAQTVRERVHMEPGPAGDLMYSEVSKPEQFFYNTQYLQDFHKSGKEKKKSLPGYHYFQKISNFVETHIRRGELFLEFRKGVCTRDGEYEPCNFCKEETLVKASPQPFPDYTALPEYKYLDFQSTHDLSQEREIDDYLPRSNIKKLFNKHEIASDDVNAVLQFSEKYIVKKELVVKYCKHLEYLELNKTKPNKMQQDITNEKNQANADSEDVIDSEKEDESMDEGQETIIASVGNDPNSDIEDETCRRSTRTRKTCYKTRAFLGDSD